MLTGVLGGSFDPPHQGHLALANAAITEGFVERVVFVPTFHSWHKSGVETSASKRLRMLEMLMKDSPNFSVSSCDVERGGNTYSIDTIADLRQAQPQDSFAIILGSDAFNALSTWHRANELIEQVSFLVASRSDRIIENPLGARLQVLQTVMPEISSTRVRNLVQAGCSRSELAELTNGEIAEFILEQRLYA